MNAIGAAAESLATLHYFDRDVSAMAVKLLPAQYYVTTTGTVLTTVLGSCVAACLIDVEAGVAGMNHFMLPDDAESAPRSAHESMRYGACAMNVLIRELVGTDDPAATGTAMSTRGHARRMPQKLSANMKNAATLPSINTWLLRW